MTLFMIFGTSEIISYFCVGLNVVVVVVVVGLDVDFVVVVQVFGSGAEVVDKVRETPDFGLGVSFGLR